MAARHKAAPTAAPAEGSTTVFEALTYCLYYAGSAIAISLVNKAILSQYGFRCTFFLLAFQLTFSLAFCIFQRIGPASCKIVDIPAFDLDVYSKSLKVSITFVANVACSFIGIRLVSVPMFLVLRRTTTLFTLFAEFLLLGAVPSRGITASCVLIAAGSILAGVDDIAADWVAIAAIIANNILTAASYTLNKHFTQETKVSPFGLLYYQSITALPLAIINGFISGEWEILSAFPYLTDSGFILSMVISSLLGVFLNYAVVLCSTLNSPVATSVTGNLKDLITTIAGALIFPDFTPTFWVVSGIAVSFVGACWFSFLKLGGMLMLQAKKPAAPAPTPAHASEIHHNSEEAQTLLPTTRDR